jgi:tRNA/rRNA methyltransferase
MHTVILVEPEIPENTGFIARLAANFDFSMRIVSPGFNLEEARKTAKNAQGKLRNAEIFDSVEKAVDDLDYVIGTKPGKGNALEQFETSQNTSVMIGRESSGLSNEELELCDAVVHIETAGYNSLNQSHAAAIFFHKLQTTDGKDKEGVSKGQVNELNEILPENVAETLLEANPSKSKVNRILGELKQNKI